MSSRVVIPVKRSHFTRIEARLVTSVGYSRFPALLTLQRLSTKHMLGHTSIVTRGRIVLLGVENNCSISILAFNLLCSNDTSVQRIRQNRKVLRLGVVIGR
jgi:hypothetical protein